MSGSEAYRAPWTEQGIRSQHTSNTFADGATYAGYFVICALNGQRRFSAAFLKLACTFRSFPNLGLIALSSRTLQGSIVTVLSNKGCAWVPAH